MALLALLSGCQSCLNVRPGAYPCDPSATAIAECPTGWRCGLSGRCHATGPGAAAAYACARDSDCEGGWRCSAAGVCVDPINEALSATQYEGPLTHQLLSPLILDQPPLLFTHTNETLADSSRSSIYVSVVDGGAVEQVALVSPADGGALVRMASQIPAGPSTALAAVGHRNFLLVDGGFLEADRDGGTWFFPVTGATDLRIQPSATIAILNADSGYLLAQPTTRTVRTVQMPGACSGDPVDDLLLISAPIDQGNATPGSVPTCTLAVTPSGLFYANYTLQGGFLVDPGTDAGIVPPWTPIPGGFPGAPTCGVPSNNLNIQRLFPGHHSVGVSLLDPNGGAEAALIGFDGQSSDAGIWDSCTTGNPCCGRLGNAFLFGPCPVCGSLALAEVRPVSASPPTIDVRCVDALSGQSSWFSVSGTTLSCGSPFPLFSDSGLFLDRVIYNGALPQDHPYAGAHGEVWLGTDSRRDQGPQLLDHRPSFLLEFDGGIEAVSTSSLVDGDGLIVPIQDSSFWTAAQGFVLQSFRTEPSAYAGRVSNRPSWVINGALTVIDLDAPPGFSVIAVGANPQTVGPIGGFVAATPDGGSELRVWAIDALYAVDITQRLADPLSPTPVTLVSRLVPNPGNEIQRAVFLPSDGGVVPGPDGTSRWMRGYVLTRNGVFELTADSPIDWRATPISISQGQPVAVWLDGNRGRLGFADGTVDSLPGLVPLSEPLPEEQPLASAFGSMCGQGYAVGSQALYRLARNPDGGTLGIWAAEPLQGVDPFATTGSFGFSGGLMTSFPDHAYLSSTFGEVLLLAMDGGCP